MKSLELNASFGKCEVKLPTSIDEIPNEWLSNVSSGISLAPHYSLIAIIIKDSLGLMVNTNKNKANNNVSVIPVFIKSNTQDSDFISNLKCGDKIIVSATDVSMGNHVNCTKNSLSANKIVSIIKSSKEYGKNIMFDNTPIFCVEFKIIPNSAIKAASYETNYNPIEDLFVVNIEKDTNE